MMNLKPLGDRVIVKQDEAEETTAGGLILAHDAKEKPQTGVVLKVGEGKLDKDGNFVPVPVKEGDRVLYGKYGGTEVKVHGFPRLSRNRTASLSCMVARPYGTSVLRFRFQDLPQSPSFTLLSSFKERKPKNG